MLIRQNNIKCFLLTFCSLFLLVGCGGKKTFSSSSGSGSGGGGGGTTVVTSPNGGPGGSVASVGTKDQSAFWVAAVAPEDGFTMVTRASTAYTDFCQIDNGTVDTTVNCYVDVEENDLYTQGLSLQYNVPGDMCEYLERIPYWYYDKPVGEGPTSYSVVRTFDAADDFLSVQCSVNGGALQSCDSTLSDELDVGVVNDTGTDITCTYDCCIGDYTLTVIADHLASGGALTSTITKKSWGSSYSACLGGSVFDSWSAFTKTHMPASLIVNIPSVGINDVQKLIAPIKSFRPSNMQLANYYGSVSHLHSGFATVATSTLPFPIAPIDDLSGDSVRAGWPAYTFMCLDRAYEVRNIINVYIRDWDTKEKFQLYLTTDGATETPDQPTDVEGTGCDGIGNMCDDFFDWDDFLTQTLGSYSTASPGLRKGYFPNERD